MSEMPPPAPAGPQPTGNPKADAKASKAYAKASRPWYQKKRWWVVGIILIIAIGGALGGGGEDETTTASDSSSEAGDNSGSDESNSDSNDKDADSGEEKAPKPEKAEAGPKPVAVTAATIIKEFEENELAADSKYKDKSLKVTGVVEKIDADLFDGDKYILQLGAGTDFEIVTVNCNDMSTDELSTINKGDKVTVIGEFDDGGDLGVEVSDCKLA